MVVKHAYINNPIRFNELFRFCQEYAKKPSSVKKMSKPTFNEHLTHLIKKKIVKRKQLGKQQVILYLDVTNPKVVKLKETSDQIFRDTEKISKIINNPAFWTSLPEFISCYFALCELRKQKIILDYGLNPDKNQDNILSSMIEINFQNNLEARLILQLRTIIEKEINPVKRAEFKNKVFASLDKAIGDAEKYLFNEVVKGSNNGTVSA